MELTLTNIVVLIIGLVVLYWLIKFAIKSIGTIIKVVIAVVVLLVATWILKPELFNEYLGAENVAAIENVVNKKTAEVDEKAKEIGKKVGETVKEKVTE